MNDWIEWNGGECPIDEGALIDVKYKIGEYSKAPCVAGNMAWERYGGDYEIFAYRLHRPAQQEEHLTAQLRTATVKRDKQAAKAARHAEKLQHREAEVERLKSELERHIEAETGLSCTIGEKVSGIPDSSIPVGAQLHSNIPEGVDVNDPKTWKEGDVVECVMVGCFSDHSPLPYTAGKEYVFDSLDKMMDPLIKENDYGRVDSFYSDRLKFRFVRRPA